MNYSSFPIFHDFCVNGNTLYAEIQNKCKGNDIDKKLRAAKFIIDALEDISNGSYKLVFPAYDTKVTFEFGTDEEIYDCIMGVNFNRTKGDEHIVEINSNEFLDELARSQYKKPDIANTMLYRFLIHDIQHIKNGREMMEFFDKIDNSLKNGRITPNQYWELLAFIDMKYEGIAETIERKSRDQTLRGDDMRWFRKKFDKFARIKGKTPKELDDKLVSHYEDSIRMRHQGNHRKNVQDNYVNAKNAFFMIGADNVETAPRIVDSSGAPISKNSVGSALMQEKGKVIILLNPDTREAYDLIDSSGVSSFLSMYEHAHDSFEIPEDLRAININEIKPLLEKLGI